MINSFEIKNFKSHSDTNLKFSNLNVFTGLNGMGKSSVIQALLLLRQTYLKNMLGKGLELKADLCNIGIASDAIYQSSVNDIIEFTLQSDKGKNKSWSFIVDDKKLTDTFLKCKNTDNSKLSSISLFNNNFQYISAYRNGPVPDYDKDTSGVELFNQISVKEGRCELIAHYLDYFKNSSIVDDSLKKSSKDDNALLFQVEKWLQEITPGINIHVESLESSYKINYSFSRGSGKTPTNEFKAMNIGFGVSYTLPIVVAALHSKKDSLIVIENPEAHIHPDGQAKLMELICKAAKAGIQFIIETHSDHIINGLLVATMNNIITPGDSKVYFFDRDISSHSTMSIHLPILSGGKIKKPPIGFFDRLEKDMKNLMGF